MADYPHNFTFDPATQKLSWDAVPDADNYDIQYKQVNSHDWIQLYTGGTSTEVSFPVPIETYAVRGKARQKGEWGVWSPVETVVVS
jgi:chitodextrinase